MTNLLTLMGVTDAAIKQAADHADAVVAEWTNSAYDHLVRYARENRYFKTEDVRLAAHKAGLPKPPDARAWGAVMRRAVAQNVVTKLGFGVSTEPQAHMRPAAVWQSTVFGRPG